MRVRLGVGLPGPFVLTSGRRRRRSPNGAAWLAVLGLFALAIGWAHPWIGAVLILFVGALVLAARTDVRRTRR